MTKPENLLLIIGCALLLTSALGSCDFTVFSSLRSTWLSRDEPCRQKLSFEMWTRMKAELSPPNADAQYIRENCLLTQDIGALEIRTREKLRVSDVPGEVASRYDNGATYVGATATTLEALCNDDNVVMVARVESRFIPSTPASSSRRRLQTTVSEAAQAHQVAELIAGLENLGCASTTGEGQTLCVMSDSFDTTGIAADLQASGDLPEVEVVEELPSPFLGTDEGAAMIELAFDVASGANYKFNYASEVPEEFAADIALLATQEGCDVIVDDVLVLEPSFRDGVISIAIDDAVDAGSLFFSSAGNSGLGHRFTSDFEVCDPVLSDQCGDFAGPVHVFNPNSTGITRYLLDAELASPTNATRALYFASWDAEISTDEDIAIAFFFLNDDGEFLFSGVSDSAGLYAAIVQLTPTESFIEADFHLLTWAVGGLKTGSDGSMYGHACASNSIAVAAIDVREATGPNGEFEDPETSQVETLSSRGPCIVRGDTREKPTTCAADGVSTSTPGFETFFGTSAASPVAAAIATIVRAACFPKVVGYAEMLEMLTDYRYTIDYTSDAEGDPETWGSEAGHGIISARQMLAWVEANCAESCPGGGAAPVDAPTPAAVGVVTPAGESGDGAVDLATSGGSGIFAGGAFSNAAACMWCAFGLVTVAAAGPLL